MRRTAIEFILILATSSGQLFADAIGSFRETIAEEKREKFAEFPNSEAMLKEMELACSRHKDKTRLFACYSKVALFSDVFEPYFDVMNVFVQVKPEYMGIIWGVILLIFKVSWISAPRHQRAKSLSAGNQSCRVLGEDREHVREIVFRYSSLPETLRYLSKEDS